MSTKSRILVDVEETNRERMRDGSPLGGSSGPVVFTMLTQKPLYRILDERELEHIVKTGKITGGSFSTSAEKRWGAQWGEDITEVIEFGLNWKKTGRLRGRLFLAKLDAFDRKMFHLDPKIYVRDVGPDKETEIDWNTCNTGLGCSVPDVRAEDVEWFLVNGTNIRNVKFTELDPKYERPYPLDDGDSFVVVKGSTVDRRLKRGVSGKVVYVQEGSLLNLRVGKDTISTRPTAKIDWKKNEMTVGIGFLTKGQVVLKKL